MKKLFTLLALSFCAISAFAYDVEVDGIYYNVVKKAKTAEVTYKSYSNYTYYSDYSGDISIPESIVYDGVECVVNSIGDWAFSSCNDLISVILPSTIKSIGSYSFAFCECTNDIVLPEMLETIGDEAFYYCDWMTSINIPSTVTKVGKQAFTSCNNLKSVFIKDLYSWCKIEFDGSNPLENTEGFYLNGELVEHLVFTDERITTIGKYAFYGYKKLQSVDLGNNIEKIEDRAFERCTGLSSISFGSSLKSIGYSAFSQSSSLTKAIIPNTVTYIGGSAFSGCSSLIEISISDNVPIIEQYTFSNCEELKKVSLGTGITEIGRDAFRLCDKISSVYIKDLSAWLKIWFISYQSNPLHALSQLYVNDVLLQDLVIPESVNIIRQYAFYGCKDLKSIKLGNSTKEIERYAFNYCKELEFADLNGPITKIGDNAFSGCTKLKELIFGETLTSIAYNAYENCQSIISLVFPNSLSRLEYASFKGCSSLTTISFGESISSISSEVFANCPELTDVICFSETVPWASDDAFKKSYIEYCNLYVPAASVNAYKTTDPWSGFGTIEALPTYDLAIGSANWSTLYVDFPFELPTDMKAYVVDGVSATSVTIKEVTGVIPANTPVMLHGDAGTYTLEYTSNTPQVIEQNYLKGVLSNTTCVADENYVLADKGDGTVAFGLYHGTTITANKAYLPGSAIPSSSRPASISIDSESGIENIAFDVASDLMYDLQGRQIKEYKKGINIVGGKKIIVK